MLSVLGFRHRQRLDVITAAGEQTNDAGQHARLIVHQHRERVGFRLLRSRRYRIMARWGSIHHTITLPSSVTASSTLTPASPRSISLCARPDGIIGKQFSLGSTTQSNSTGLSTAIISLIARSRSAGFWQRMPWA